MTAIGTHLVTIGSILIFALVSFAQKSAPSPASVEQYTAPIEWKLYSVSAADSAIKFPKLPVRRDENDLCRETQASIYNAYADQAVYEFRYYMKATVPIPSTCPFKQGFGLGALERRLAELRNSNPAPISETDVEVNWSKAKVFKWKTPDEIVTRWVLPDMGNNRWREMQISYRPDKNPQEKLFTDSLIFSSKNGIEISVGNPATLGDKGFDLKPPLAAEGAEIKNSLVLKSKPQPPYTELARQRNTQGEVHLRVTFLANGGIGNVIVDSELPNGLTEQAVAAAQKIVFLPARINNVPVTTIRQVHYSFLIY